MSNPYKDIASYGYKDSSKFKGREEDIKKFFSILNSEICSVLYAESGIGKTSFINAGIEPIMIQRGFFPIHVLIPEYVFKKSDADFSIETWLVEYIKSYNENEEKSKILDKELFWKKIPIEIEDNIVTDRDKVKETLHKFRGNLWWLLHTYSLQVDKRVYRPYIVFDQFEEIFVKTAQEKSSGLLKDFFSLMEQVTSNSIPDIIRSGLDELANVGAYFRINSEAEYKITFSLRKEFLSDFDYWTNEVYSISELYRNRMMLRPLTKKQAENVITKQPIEDEAADDNKYDETLKEISDDIIKKIDDKDKDVIEPVLLSIICSRLYDKASTLQKNKLDKSDLQLIDISTEISHFYDGLVQKLIKEKVFKGNRDVERFEDLFVSEADGHRMRKSMRDDKDLQAFARGHIKEYKDSKDVLRTDRTVFNDLEGVHLIRRSNVGEDTYIELIHDRFAEVIHQKQIKRNEMRLDKFWKYGCLAFIIALFLYTIFYTCGNPSGNGGYCSYYTEITNRVVDSGIGHSGFAEELCIKENGYYYTLDWYHLKKIEVKSTESINLEVSGCPQLTDIYLTEDVVDKAVLNVKKCRRVNIHIKSDVDTLKIYSDALTTLTFDIKNGRYKQFLIYRRMTDREELDNNYDSTSPSMAPIIWDRQYKKAVYISPRITDHFRFPDELCIYDSLYYDSLYNRKWYFNIKSDTIIDCREIPLAFKTNNCRNVRSIVLTDSVRRIHNYGFSNFNNLEKIEFSDNLDTIGAQAFMGLTKLESVIIPKSVNLIGAEAFRDCSSLKRVIFKTEKAITICKDAFLGCSSLEYVELPDSIVSDDLPHIFAGCININKVKIKNPQKSNLAIKDKVVYEKDSGIPLLFFTDYCVYSDKSSGYYSENGILYHDIGNGREMVFTPKHADFLALTKYSQYTSSGDWIIDWGNSIIYSHVQNKDLRIPALQRKPLQNLWFWLTPDSLERIYSPYPQPDCKDSVLFRVLLPDSIKSRIVLYVPYGCKKYYLNHPAFRSFKSIEEESAWRRPFNIIYAYAESTMLFLKQHKEIACLLCLFILGAGYVFYKIEKKVYANTLINRSFSINRIILHTINKLVLFILIYTILYHFILILFIQNSLLIVNLIAIPLSIITIYVMSGRKSFENRWIIIKYFIRGLNWEIVVTSISVLFFICILFFQARNLFNLDKMLSKGKYNRATSLMYSQIMNKDSIVSEDSILIRKVLLSSEGFPYLAENEGFSTNVTSIEPFKDKNLLLITKQDSVILLDFANHEQHKYKIPQSKSYYVDDKFVYGYSNSDYAFICKRKETVSDSIKGRYLHFADNGKYVVSKTDSMCYIYDIQNKPKLIKAFHWENPSFVEVTQSSHYLAVQENSNSPVEVYDISSGGKIFASGVKGRLSFLSDSLLITSDYKHTFIYKLNNTTLSLLHEIKGYSPTILENNEINIITKGGSYKTFFHRINNSECRTDSVNAWIYSYQIGEYSEFWNWDVVRHFKNLGKQSLISLNDRYMIVRNDSSQITSIYDINGKCRLMKSIKGKSPDVLNSEGETLFCIKSLQEDSIYVYKGIKQIFKHPHNSYQSISNNYLLERFGDRVKIIRLDNPSESYILEDEGRHFPVGDCVIFDGWIFNKYRGNYDNILPTDELIDRCDYLSEKQKQGLKRKITYQSSGN